MLGATRLCRQDNPNCARPVSYGLASRDEGNQELKACWLPVMVPVALGAAYLMTVDVSPRSWKPYRIVY